MKETEKLRLWVEAERAKGLVDIKFFPGAKSQSSIEEMARNINQALTSTDAIDATSEEF